MAILIVGVALWMGAHLFKRVAPDARAALTDRFGTASKGAFAVLLLLSVVLMVIGYRAADGAVFWGRGNGLVWLNNLLMVLAFYVYLAGGPKGARVWLGTKLRHPQLLGFSLWAVAHLLVNGDVASFILFGGLLAWALAEIALINAREPEWVAPERAATGKEIGLVVITLVAVSVVMAIHFWLGVQPWG